MSKLPYAVDSESHKLAMTISRDVHVSVSGITFDDVVGLEGAKQLLQEAVVFPVKCVLQSVREWEDEARLRGPLSECILGGPAAHAW